MRSAIVFILLFIPCLVFAPHPGFTQAHDIRISDEQGDVLDIASDGTIPLLASDGNTTKTVAAGANDVRISDADGDVLAINSNGTVTVYFQ